MRVETLVLDREDGVHHLRRHAIERNLDALLDEKGESRLPFAVVDDRGLGLRCQLGQLGRAVELGGNAVDEREGVPRCG